MKRAIVFGAGGFIGNAMVTRLKREGYYVTGIDIKDPEFSKTKADLFFNIDLTSDLLSHHFSSYKPKNNIWDYQFVDEIYQFAAEMGGAEFIFTGKNDAQILHDSALINLNVLHLSRLLNAKKIFFASSACVYPQHIQESPDNKGLKEKDAIPGNPDSAYGWEKLFSEQLYNAYHRNHGMDIRIGRFHNIYGPYGTFDGPRAKAPAALARKVAMAASGGCVEIFGDGKQTRSFCYIDDCVEGVRKLMESDYTKPLNIGSSQMVSIDELAKMLIKISGKKLTIKHIEGPLGVRGRNSDNTLCKQVLNWEPTKPLQSGLKDLYHWVNKQVNGLDSK